MKLILGGILMGFAWAISIALIRNGDSALMIIGVLLSHFIGIYFGFILYKKIKQK